VIIGKVLIPNTIKLGVPLFMLINITLFSAMPVDAEMSRATSNNTGITSDVIVSGNDELIEMLHGLLT